MASRMVASNFLNSEVVYRENFENDVSAGGYNSSYFELNINMHIATARRECFPLARFKPLLELRMVVALGKSKKRFR